MRIVPLPRGLMISYLPIRPESSLRGAWENDGASGWSVMGVLQAPETLPPRDRGIRRHRPRGVNHEARPHARLECGARAGFSRALPSAPAGLAGHGEPVPSVAGPALLGRFVADLDLFSVGDGLETILPHSQGDQVVVGGSAPPLAQGQVVLDRAPLVAVALDRDPEEIEALQDLRVLGEDLLVAFPDVGFVEV